MTAQINDNVIDLFAAFATDEDAERSGVETQLDGCGNTMFRIAAIDNENYLKLARQLYKRNKQTLTAKGSKAAENAAEAKAKEVEVELLAKTVLLGWTGTVRFNNEDLPYSVDNAKKLLGVKAFRKIVADKAAPEGDLFKAVKIDEEDEGN